MKLKSCAVAGSFYPADPKQLKDLTMGLLATNPCTGSRPQAIIVPHAGLRYSGAIAALAFNRVRPYLSYYQRIIILGPAHTEAFDFTAAIDAQKWRTPLGDINLDTQYTEQLIELKLLKYFDKAHALEHSLELQLPLLQCIGLKDLPIVPIVVGGKATAQTADLMQHLLQDDKNLLIISSDLSHFHPYHQAMQTDTQTIEKIKAAQSNITPRQACGCYPLNALLSHSEQFLLNVEQLGYCNSGDTGTNRESVVGYSAFALTPTFSQAQRKHMLALARQAIADGLIETSSLNIDSEKAYLQSQQACFVSLKIPDSSPNQLLQLRGCIGNLQVNGSLYQRLCRNAYLAAFKDSRFPPLSAAEFAQVIIEISILSTPESIEVTSQQQLLTQLKPGIDGLILRYQDKQATFLPSVWQQLPDPQQFVEQLKQKAQLAPDFWSNEMQCSVYHSITFSEKSITNS